LRRPDRTLGCIEKAIFLDRDGVLNRNVFYADTGQWESPRSAAAFALCPGVLPALQALQAAGYALFIVSNQPNAAKGKATAGDLAAIHEQLMDALGSAGIRLHGTFYCTHAPAVHGPCVCRKPSPWFLNQGIRAYGLRPEDCWMIGDRVTDMQCGRAAGVATAWVRTGQEPSEPEEALYDAAGAGLAEVAAHILQCGHRGYDAAAARSGNASASGARALSIE
jgi:D-glycero-D-manno-heptose 1,7-bisphosphate phosphatase